MPRLVLNTSVKRGAFAAIREMVWFGPSLLLSPSLSISVALWTHSFCFFFEKNSQRSAAICSRKSRDLYRTAAICRIGIFSHVSNILFRLHIYQMAQDFRNFKGLKFVFAASVVSHGPISKQSGERKEA